VLGVSARIEQGGRLLLVRRGKAPSRNFWSFPGGHVEFGESLANAAAREVREEAGIEVAIDDVIDRAEIIERGEDGGVILHYVLVVFGGRYVSGELAAGDDAAEARWVAPDEAGGLEMTPDTKRIWASFRP